MLAPKGIYPLNSKAMDEKIKPSEVYTKIIIYISNEKNDSFNGRINDIK